MTIAGLRKLQAKLWNDSNTVYAEELALLEIAIQLKIMNDGAGLKADDDGSRYGGKV